MDKSKYYQLKQKGICPTCRKSLAEKGKIKCKKCLEDDRLYQLKKRKIKQQIYFKLIKNKYSNKFIKFLSEKSDFELIKENEIYFFFKYKGDKEKAKFYLKANKILYKNLLKRRKFK